MTALLLRLFVGNHPDSTAPKVRAAAGRLSGIVGIVCNFFLFLGKFIAGTLTGSVSITADAMNNLSDATSSVVTLIGFRLAEKPADADHPYGHARFEYLAGLAVAGLIVVIGADLAKTSLNKILHPSAVAFSLPAAIVLAVSIAVKLWIMLFNRRLGKYIDSTALLATAADSRNDVISTAAVLAASVVEMLTSWRIDGYMGIAVALFILYSGACLAKEIISPLLGEGASPELRQQILQTVQQPLVLGYHDLMVHDYGPGQRFASLHVEMDQNVPPMKCHACIDSIERMCLEKYNVHLVIHYDPVVVGDPELEQKQALIQNALLALDERLFLHDFRMVRGAQHRDISFDVALPFDLIGQEDRIRQSLEKTLAEACDELCVLSITFDPESA